MITIRRDSTVKRRQANGFKMNRTKVLTYMQQRFKLTDDVNDDGDMMELTEMTVCYSRFNWNVLQHGYLVDRDVEDQL